MNYEDKIELATKIFSKIIDCVDVYFGIRQGQLSDAFVKKAVTKIASDFPKLSIQDIEYSFDRYNIPKKDTWKNITIDEVIAPIKQYYNIKNKISIERFKLEQEIKEQEQRNTKEQEFIAKAKETYLKSLENGLWIGDMFQAKVLLNRFTKYYTQEMREEFKKQSRIEELRIIESGKIDAYLFTSERILAEMVIKDCVKNGYAL